MTNPVYVSAFHGCAYAIVRDNDTDGDYLIMTPQFTDGSYDPDQNNWAEVDEMALLGEEACHREHIDFVWEALQQMMHPEGA